MVVTTLGKNGNYISEDNMRKKDLERYKLDGWRLV